MVRGRWRNALRTNFHQFVHSEFSVFLENGGGAQPTALHKT